MSARRTYLVAYDVCDDRRLRQTFKKLCGFGDPLQYSVFRCELSDAERQLMISALSTIIHHKEDRVLIADMGTRKRRAPRALRFLGRHEPTPEQSPVVF
jgi:CRISPR-associated protein Cas2